MASGNGCFTAFIKACSSQRCVFPLKFSSMNLAIRGHYGLRFQVTVEHCIIWLVLLIMWNTAFCSHVFSLLPLTAILLLLSNVSPASSCSSSPCTSPLPAPQHVASQTDKRPCTFHLKNNDLPLVLSSPLPSTAHHHNPLWAMPPLFTKDINQLRWKLHNCACWEGFEQNCTMNFLKGIFTSRSARLGRWRKVRPQGFMGLESSLLKSFSCKW